MKKPFLGGEVIHFSVGLYSEADVKSGVRLFLLPWSAAVITCTNFSGQNRVEQTDQLSTESVTVAMPR
jgi:hypothetical protein